MNRGPVRMYQNVEKMGNRCENTTHVVISICVCVLYMMTQSHNNPIRMVRVLRSILVSLVTIQYVVYVYHLRYELGPMFYVVSYDMSCIIYDIRTQAQYGCYWFYFSQ